MSALLLAALAIALTWLAAIAARRALEAGRSRNASLRMGAAVPEPQPRPGTRVGKVVTAALERAAVPGSSARWWAVWRAVVVMIALGGAIVAGPGIGVVLGAGAVAGPAVALRLASGRADAAYERCVPVLLEEAARKLRAGSALGDALVAAGDSGACGGAPGLEQDLAQLARALNNGEDLASGIAAWAQSRPLPGVQLAAAALRLAAEHGGAHARAVDAVAATLRQRLDQVAELRAATAQARASVAVLGVAPVAFAVVSVLLDPGTARAAVSSSAGLASVAAGLGLDLVSVTWMNRLTRQIL